MTFSDKNTLSYWSKFVALYVGIWLKRSFVYKEGNCWRDFDAKKEEDYVFQSLFCHWCQTYYFLVRQLFIWFKYYHLVDLIDEEDLKRFDQQDVTKVPRGNFELWLCNEV